MVFDCIFYCVTMHTLLWSCFHSHPCLLAEWNTVIRSTQRCNVCNVGKSLRLIVKSLHLNYPQDEVLLRLLVL